MFSRLFKTPKSSLQLFRKNQAAMLPNDAESPQVPSETFSSLPIIRKVGLKTSGQFVFHAAYYTNFILRRLTRPRTVLFFRVIS